MSGRTVSRVAGTALVVLALAPPAAAQEWSIEEFEVVAKAPWRDWEIFGGETGLAGLVPWFRKIGLDPDAVSLYTVQLDPDTKRALEAHLRRSSRQLEEWGFPPPALQPVVEQDDGSDAYRVYLVEDIEGASGEYHANLCESKLPTEAVILLDADNILDDAGKVTTKGLSTVGHELFHAVQYGTRFFRESGCEVGDWITEGQATAIGWDLVRRLHGRVDPDDVEAPKLWGLRRYSDRLPVARRMSPKQLKRQHGGNLGDPAYRTASFWRYLAEFDAARRSNGAARLPGPEPHEFDYHYLSHQLRRPPVGRGCGRAGADPECDAEVRWLNAGLLRYRHFQIGLRRIYPAFVTAFAAYGEHRVVDLGYRMDLLQSAPPSRYEGRLIWPDEVLDGCLFMGPTPEKRRIEERFGAKKEGADRSLLDLTARCFNVRPSGFGREVDIDIQIAAVDESRLAQLILGEVDGQRLATPVVSGVHPETGTARTRWTFRLPDGEESRFVLANVAAAPEDTWPQSVSVIVTVPGHEHMAQAPSDDDDPGADERPENPDPAPSDTDEAVRGRVDRALSRVTSLGRRATGVRRSEGRGKLIVSLRTLPDALNVLDPETHQGRGGVVRQAAASAAALQEVMGRMDELRAAAIEAESREGASIELQVPLVDYGFSGTFEDAEIRFSRPDDDWLEALGPDREPNGRVTIEVYEPEVLMGTFSAEVVEPHPPRGSPPVVRSVSGRFWVSSPWEEDDRMEIELSPVAVDDMRDDIVGVVPGSMAEMARDAMDEAVDREREDDAAEAGARGEARAIETPECECTCELKQRFQALMEEIRRAPRAFTPEERALVRCMSECGMQLLDC